MGGKLSNYELGLLYIVERLKEKLFVKRDR